MNENLDYPSRIDPEQMPQDPEERLPEERLDDLSLRLTAFETYLDGYSWRQAQVHASKGDIKVERNTRVVLIGTGTEVFDFSFRKTSFERIELSDWINTPIDDPSITEWRTISNADLVFVLIDSILQDKKKRNVQKLYAVVDELFFWQSKPDRAADNKSILYNWLSVEEKDLPFLVEYPALEKKIYDNELFLMKRDVRKILRRYKFLKSKCQYDREVTRVFNIWCRQHNEMERTFQEKIQNLLKEIESHVPQNGLSSSFPNYSYNFGYSIPIVREWIYKVKVDKPSAEEFKRKFDDFVFDLENQWEESIKKFIDEIGKEYAKEIRLSIDEIIDALASSWISKMDYPPKVAFEFSSDRFEGQIIQPGFNFSLLSAIRASLLDGLYSALFAAYIGTTIKGGNLIIGGVVGISIAALLATSGIRNKMQNAGAERVAVVEKELNYLMYEFSQKVAQELKAPLTECANCGTAALREIKEEAEQRITLMKCYPKFAADTPPNNLLDKYDQLLLTIHTQCAEAAKLLDVFEDYYPQGILQTDVTK